MLVVETTSPLRARLPRPGMRLLKEHLLQESTSLLLARLQPTRLARIPAHKLFRLIALNSCSSLFEAVVRSSQPNELRGIFSLVDCPL